MDRSCSFHPIVGVVVFIGHGPSTIGHLEVVELLLSRGGDPTLASSHGLVPLMGCSSGGHMGVVRRLLGHTHTAHINTRNTNGATAMWFACANGHDDVARLLLEAGADPTLPRDNGVTPLSIAGIKGYPECIDLLQVRR